MLQRTTTPPDPVMVDIVSDATPWWEIVGAFGPLAILLAALVTGAIAWTNIKHRREADQRSQWWARAEWALDASMSEDPHRQEIGLGVLDLLAQSDLAGEEEVAIIEVAWAEPLAPGVVDGNGGMGNNGNTEESIEEAGSEHNSKP